MNDTKNKNERDWQLRIGRVRLSLEEKKELKRLEKEKIYSQRDAVWQVHLGGKCIFTCRHSRLFGERKARAAMDIIRDRAVGRTHSEVVQAPLTCQAHSRLGLK